MSHKTNRTKWHKPNKQARCQRKAAKQKFYKNLRTDSRTGYRGVK